MTLKGTPKIHATRYRIHTSGPGPSKLPATLFLPDLLVVVYADERRNLTFHGVYLA
jgi:hypothetical protein